MSIQSILAKLDPTVLIDERFTESDQAKALENLAQADEYPPQQEDEYLEREEQLLIDECKSINEQEDINEKMEASCEQDYKDFKLSSFIDSRPVGYSIFCAHRGYITKAVIDDKNHRVILS